MFDLDLAINITTIVSMLANTAMVALLLRRRWRDPPVVGNPGILADALVEGTLVDLRNIGRASGGRVSIHDIEVVIRKKRREVSG